MPSGGHMRDYPGFPPAIPHLGAGCVRVTHPFAARQHPRRGLLPLDLHVLGLPLAFILSQDQTLHSKENLIKISACPVLLKIVIAPIERHVFQKRVQK